MGLAKLLKRVGYVAVVGLAGISVANYLQHHDKYNGYATFGSKMDGIFSWTEIQIGENTTVRYKSWLINDVELTDLGNDGKVEGYLIINNGIIKYNREIKNLDSALQKELERFSRH